MLETATAIWRLPWSPDRSQLRSLQPLRCPCFSRRWLRQSIFGRSAHLQETVGWNMSGNLSRWYQKCCRIFHPRVPDASRSAKLQPYPWQAHLEFRAKTYTEKLAASSLSTNPGTGPRSNECGMPWDALGRCWMSGSRLMLSMLSTSIVWYHSGMDSAWQYWFQFFVIIESGPNPDSIELIFPYHISFPRCVEPHDVCGVS